MLSSKKLTKRKTTNSWLHSPLVGGLTMKGMLGSSVLHTKKDKKTHCVLVSSV